MAAKKAPAKKTAAKKPASPADVRKAEEAGKAKMKAKGRMDVYGQSGMGQTKSGLRSQAESRIEAAGKSALKAFGVKAPSGLLSATGSPNFVSASVKGLSPAQRKVLETVMKAEAQKPRPKKKK